MGASSASDSPCAAWPPGQSRWPSLTWSCSSPGPAVSPCAQGLPWRRCELHLLPPPACSAVTRWETPSETGDVEGEHSSLCCILWHPFDTTGLGNYGITKENLNAEAKEKSWIERKAHIREKKRAGAPESQKSPCNRVCWWWDQPVFQQHILSTQLLQPPAQSQVERRSHEMWDGERRGAAAKTALYKPWRLSFAQAESFCLETGTEDHLLSSAVYSCKRPDSADGGRGIKWGFFWYTKLFWL